MVASVKVSRSSRINGLEPDKLEKSGEIIVHTG